MTFSVTTHYDGDSDIRLDVTGAVLGSAAAELRLLITKLTLIDRPNTLLVNLQDVTALGVTGIEALLTGYLTAMDYGTSYQVLRAHGQARDVLQATGIIDMLADSDDLGALLLAVLAFPAPQGAVSGNET